MIDMFALIGSVWSALFSWLVYPVRVPLQVAASVAVSYAVARHALPLLKPLPEWLAGRLSWLLGTCLFAFEYAVTRALLDAGKAQPVALRVYGHWVENLTDWLTGTGRAAGRGLAKCAGLPFRAVLLATVLYLVGYNMHVIGPADGPGADAPVVTWWDRFAAWSEAPDPSMLEERGEDSAG